VCHIRKIQPMTLFLLQINAVRDSLIFRDTNHYCSPTHVIVWVKVKAKFTLHQATKAQRGSRGIALLFL